jgi:signal transduction histidine kinase
VLRPRAPLAPALLAAGVAGATALLASLDLYPGVGALFTLQTAAETLLPVLLLRVVLRFPQPWSLPRAERAAWGLCLVLLVAREAFLGTPRAYVALFDANLALLALVGACFGLRLLGEYRRGRSALSRQRIRVITLGTLVGFGAPAVLLVVSLVGGGRVGDDLAALTPFLFALALAFAVVKQDLFELDAMVRRGAYYLLLSGAVGVFYVAALVVLAGVVTDSPAFPVLFTFAVLLFINPLRTRLQTLVDRLFSRTRYDGAQVLANVGGELAGTLQRERIAALVRACVETAIPNAGTRLLVHEPGAEAVDGLAPALGASLADGRVVTGFDAPEQYGEGEVHEAVRAGLAALEAEIAVPLLLRGELVGVLLAGAKRSGLFYGAGDVEFLRALANQAAIALGNARTYEALAALNTRLEERVRDRTGQLEGANRELAEAYAELKLAEVQLVQSEKMASLGRLVAGVAHEINNPVTFIATSVAPLRRRLERLVREAPPEVAALLREADEIVDVMARGAERTAAIVKDLRSFSRLGEADRKPVDLHEGLETTVRLLEPRWRDRVAIHRDYGSLPRVECDAGQLNQVFMNLLANACDAIPARGNVWITTRATDDAVTVTIRDDGAGIAPDVLGRIFDPFFSTKDVGGGTGLGLAISHGVVAAHGGRIEVESAVGRGSVFRVVLPRGGRAASLDSAASGSG